MKPFVLLWEPLADVVRKKLASGDWIARGYTPAVGPTLQTIDPPLWNELEIDFDYSASGGGFDFVGLLISENTARSALQTPKGGRLSRLTLKKWIEDYSWTVKESMTTDQVFEIARAIFKGQVISRYLFNQAWEAAEKRPGFVQRGRPRN